MLEFPDKDGLHIHVLRPDMMLFVLREMIPVDIGLEGHKKAVNRMPLPDISGRTVTASVG